MRLLAWRWVQADMRLVKQAGALPPKDLAKLLSVLEEEGILFERTKYMHVDWFHLENHTSSNADWPWCVGHKGSGSALLLGEGSITAAGSWSCALWAADCATAQGARSRLAVHWVPSSL
jgi:hypothetical protein